jgi:hypothetical protein
LYIGAVVLEGNLAMFILISEDLKNSKFCHVLGIITFGGN